MSRHAIKIVNLEGEILEEVELRNEPPRLILYRGRLLEILHDDEHKTDEYIERSYLEIT